MPNRIISSFDLHFDDQEDIGQRGIKHELYAKISHKDQI